MFLVLVSTQILKVPFICTVTHNTVQSALESVINIHHFLKNYHDAYVDVKMNQNLERSKKGTI